MNSFILNTSNWPPIEDMSKGLNEWRNIQDIVRVSFKTVFEVLEANVREMKKQAEEIRRLEDALRDSEMRANDRIAAAKQEMNFEMNRIIKEMSRQIENKVSMADFLATIDKKADKEEVKAALNTRTTVNDFNHIIADIKADVTNVNALANRNAMGIQEIREDVAKQAHMFEVMQSELQQKANITDVNESLQLKANKQTVGAALQRKANKAEVDSQLELKANIADVNNCLAQKADIDAVTASLETKANKRELMDYIEEKSREVAASIMREVRSSFVTIQDFDSKAAAIETIQSAIASRPDRTELKSELKTEVNEAIAKATQECKASAIECMNAIQAAKTDINSVLETKVSKEAVCHALKKKVSLKDIKKLCEKYSKLEQIKKELLLKANIEDICKLLDSKANADDVRNQIMELKQIAAHKTDSELFTRTLHDQAVINEALLAQNTLGRWIWKSGKLKSGHGVPWNVQVINTNPENFIWEKDRVNIVVAAPGLYEVTFGFFSKKKPTVQLHVNGEPVLTVSNTSPSVVHHTGGRLSITSHSAGNVTGLTLIDFLALPERARVAVSYSGDENAEGFLGLRKL